MVSPEPQKGYNYIEVYKHENEAEKTCALWIFFNFNFLHCCSVDETLSSRFWIILICFIVLGSVIVFLFPKARHILKHNKGRATLLGFSASLRLDVQPHYISHTIISHSINIYWRSIMRISMFHWLKTFFFKKGYGTSSFWFGKKGAWKLQLYPNNKKKMNKLKNQQF